jgi:hypothetical protein
MSTHLTNQEFPETSGIRKGRGPGVSPGDGLRLLQAPAPGSPQVIVWGLFCVLHGNAYQQERPITDDLKSLIRGLQVSLLIEKRPHRGPFIGQKGLGGGCG